MKGFLLDLNRCTGCHACLLACSIENALGAGNSWRQLYTFNLRRHPGVASFHLSLACLHCSDPACMKACPAAAYARDPATGAVLIDSARCIGCKYCSWACPFDAPLYSRAEGTISKCTLCNDRLHSGNNPACTSLCPTGALQFAELETESAGQCLPGFPATGLGPSIRFTPLRSSGAGPELTAVQEVHAPATVTRIPDATAAPKISVETEWSLVFFSLAAALLVAIAGAGIAGSVRIDAIDFLIAAVGTIGISALHLGKCRRAWRAILNLRQSWLSREIASFTAFTVLTSTLLLFPAGAALLSWPAALTGFAALFCIDQVYESVSANPWSRLHSARALLTGLFLFGILTANLPIAGLTGLFKLFLYAYRQSWFKSKSRALASALRLGLGFVAPLALWRVYIGWVLPLVLIAEVIDRCEYYQDLDIVTPRGQIAADLRKALLSSARK
jgi:Fe-S-cluster-containing dehydrogenase component/DMSO reductase anchor subunit